MRHRLIISDSMESLRAPIRPGERYRGETIPLHIVDRIVEVYGPEVFLETGTYLGETVAQVRASFEAAYTIELDPRLAARARSRFRGQNVVVLEGDSGTLLPQALRALGARRALVWLDAHWSPHWSAETTARRSPEIYTAIRDELRALREASRNDHVLMIDDTLDFSGQYGYPSLDELTSLVTQINSGYDIDVQTELRRGVLVALPPL